MLLNRFFFVFFFTYVQYRRMNLSILLIFHRENVEIWILYVRMLSIAFAFRQILLLV